MSTLSEPPGQLCVTDCQESYQLADDALRNGHINGTARSAKTPAVKVKHSKSPSKIREACAWIVDHQIGISGTLISLLAAFHLLVPSTRPTTRKFFELSYYHAETGKYAIGTDDMLWVLYCIVIITGLRAGMMDFVLMPFARWGGVTKRKGCVRFAEQAWLFFYSAVSWSMGMYICYNSIYWLNLPELWTQFPTTKISGLMKWYYLVQFAFWLQQIIVVNIEEPRKDYLQMFTHHIITCALIFLSYGYLQTKVGNMILCLMDVVDTILSLAKMLKYLHFHVACDIAFGVFIVSWFMARHVGYLMVCWSVYRDMQVKMPYGCWSGATGARVEATEEELYSLQTLYNPLLQPEGKVCFNGQIKWMFMALLMALQVITLIWFGMILGVAWRILHGQAAEDSRSDGEEEDEEVGEDESNPAVHEGPTVGVNELRRRTGRSPPVRRLRKTATGRGGPSVPLPRGHSDRKELLGRIGCDKSIE